MFIKVIKYNLISHIIISVRNVFGLKHFSMFHCFPTCKPYLFSTRNILPKYLFQTVRSFCIIALSFLLSVSQGQNQGLSKLHTHLELRIRLSTLLTEWSSWGCRTGVSFLLEVSRWPYLTLSHSQGRLYIVVVVQSLNRVQLFATLWTAACQASLSFTISQSLLKLTSTELVMPSNCLILCCPLLLLPSLFPSIRVFSNELAPCIRWPKYWSFSFSISPSNEYSGLISFRMDWLDLLAVQRTLKSLLQHRIYVHIYTLTYM